MSYADTNSRHGYKEKPSIKDALSNAFHTLDSEPKKKVLKQHKYSLKEFVDGYERGDF